MKGFERRRSRRRADRVHAALFMRKGRRQSCKKPKRADQNKRQTTLVDRPRVPTSHNHNGKKCFCQANRSRQNHAAHTGPSAGAATSQG